MCLFSVFKDIVSHNSSANPISCFYGPTFAVVCILANSVCFPMGHLLQQIPSLTIATNTINPAPNTFVSMSPHNCADIYLTQLPRKHLPKIYG